MHGLIQEGTIPIDVVFLHLSPEGPNGQRSLGIANDYLIAAAKRARVVIAEVNQQMPWTYTTEALEGLRIDAFVHSDRPLIELHPGRVQEVEAKIAEHASAFIHDRSVLEMGVGVIPEAILQSLKDRRDLGIHTGMLGDVGADLMQCGAVTNAFKNIDRGLTTAGVLMGTQRLYAYAHENRQLNLRPCSHTHAVSVIAQLDNFVAVNSAVEVDLTGQVNAEIVNGQYVGATGGQVDFTRGAQLAKNGRSIVALPSATKNAQQSRIVARIASGSVTTLRTDADVIVTEWGAAQLKGQTFKERMRRMIAISHPDHRESLERHAYEVQN
jgi:acetyl-CoA hydrolase